MTAKEDKEAFLSRWSRLKQEAKDQPVPKPEDKAASTGTPPPELPPLDELTFDSDYRAFFDPKVGEDVRRAALKKLFGDPRFNVMDGLDVYIDDYSKSEPIPPAMLAGLKQAQRILEWAKGPEGEKEASPAGRQPAQSEHAALPDDAAATAPVPAVPPAEEPQAAPDPLRRRDRTV